MFHSIFGCFQYKERLPKKNKQFRTPGHPPLFKTFPKFYQYFLSASFTEYCHLRFVKQLPLICRRWPQHFLPVFKIPNEIFDKPYKYAILDLQGIPDVLYNLSIRIKIENIETIFFIQLFVNQNPQKTSLPILQFCLLRFARFFVCT